MIIVLGMAGAGKSTQCKKLEQRGGFQWFSVGQFLRSAEDDAEKAEMALGKVLDDSIVTPIVREEINKRTDNPELLLDGCPRTVGQARWLASCTETPNVRMVIHLVIDENIAMERLLKRQREDDTEYSMRRRFEGYHRDIGPVLSEFKAKNIPVFDIDGSPSEEIVFERMLGVVSK
jgi:adenylate kinase